jgi:hypothetical protein
MPDDPILVDPKDLIEMYHAVEALERGDFEPLIDRLRSDAFLFHLERELAADIIAGKLKRSPGRPAVPEMTESRAILLALCVRVLLDRGLSHERGSSGDGE